MINLPTDIKKFGFVEREKKRGKFLKNKCGRDFLYYALHYFYPEDFNPKNNNPEEIDKKKLFGLSISAIFAWTQLQFVYVPKLLKSRYLSLKINNKKINSFIDFFVAIIFSRITYGDAVAKIEQKIREGKVIGLDIAMAFEGLLDHVFFVYGFDENFYYVCDTRKVPLIQYEKVSKDDDVYYMKISKEEVKKRWKKFSRVWEIERFTE